MFVVEKIVDKLVNDWNNLTFAIWKFAFKHQTDVIRHVPSLLLSVNFYGIKIKANDFKVVETFKRCRMKYCVYFIKSGALAMLMYLS